MQKVSRLCILMYCVIGCSKRESLTVATGTVITQGSPVANAVVTFSNRAAGIEVAGRTASSGAFTIVGHGTPGLPPGDYKVTVLPLAEANQEAASGMTFSRPAPVRRVPGMSSLDRDVKTTRLTAIVRPGRNEFTFNLAPK